MKEVKGAAIKLIPWYIKKEYGEFKLQEWLNSLPKESKDLFESQVVFSKWYPLGLGFKVPINAMIEKFYDGDAHRIKEYINNVAGFVFNIGIFRSFIKIGSPHFIIGKFDKLARLFLRPVNVEIVENKNKKAVIHFPKFEGYFEALELSGLYLLEVSLNLTKAKNVNVKMISSVVQGGEFTEYECKWD